MLIDWFTVIAQTLNFLVLIALLKHFLYGPILRAMDAREQMIAQQLEKAAAAKCEADRQAESYRHKTVEIEVDRQALLAQARVEAEEQRKSLITQARDEADSLQTQWREALRREQQTFLHNLRQRVAEQVQRIARRALQDLASASLEQQVIDLFLVRLQSLEPQQREEMKISVQQSDQTALISTAFPLPDTVREELTTTIQACMATPCSVRFENTPNLVCGIELATPGHKIGWNIDHYLRTLEDGVVTALEEETRERDDQADRTADRLG